MRIFILISAFLAIFNVASLSEPHPAMGVLEKMSIGELEKQLARIDAELARLPNPSMRSGIGTIGFRSQWYTDPAHHEWIEIDLEGEVPIDKVILVPIIWRDSEGRYRADAFPDDFIIRAGKSGDPDGKVIARYQQAGGIDPGYAPVVIPIEPTVAAWVRLEANSLPKRMFDGNYVLQLSELMVFQDKRNVALRRPVETSSESYGREDAWNHRFLTDGQMPYLMDAAGGRPSVAYLSRPAAHHVFTLDLGKPYPLSEIHLHTVEQGDTVPQASSGIGLPGHLLIEGARHADFKDAKPLLDLKRSHLRETSPILMWPIAQRTCRYIRLIADVALYGPAENDFPFGFAEIELFSNEENVALGKSVVSDSRFGSSVRSEKALTDGNNLFGTILPVRDWLESLARRQKLELERPAFAAELANRYDRQKRMLEWTGWLAAVLGIGIVATIFIGRFVRRRYVARIKERLAADLHDELGADVHAIGLLSDAAEASHASPESWKTLHRRIREMTVRTGIAIRHCANMIEAKDLVIGLAEDMRRAARRSMGRFHHELMIEGEEYLEELPPQTSLDLLLFYKECLVNISKHSGASHFATKLVASPDAIRLTVSDNGKGMPGHDKPEVPSSLRRRAKLLGAIVGIEQVPGDGTRIHLNVSTRRQFFRQQHRNP